MKYDRPDDGKIYQANPIYSKPSQYKAKGWTETVEGYLYEAKVLTRCVLRNRQYMKRPYTWAIHLNHTEELPPEQVADVWTRACRKLNHLGVVAVWVREPNRLNKVHYHMLAKHQCSKKELEQAIEKAMPSRKEVKWRKRVEPIIKEWRLCHYITKAKIGGYDKHGRWITDLYARKRLLFKPKLGFKKCGVIGSFWEPGKSKEKLWDEISDEERRIAEGLERPYVRRLAQYAHDLADGYVPLRLVERSFGLYADDPVIQDWIAQLLGTEWMEDDS